MPTIVVENKYSTTDDIEVDEQIRLGIKRLAKLRKNLNLISESISDKLLAGIKDCKMSVHETMVVIGETNVTLNNKK